jgi:hypothetical protein
VSYDIPAHTINYKLNHMCIGRIFCFREVSNKSNDGSTGSPGKQTPRGDEHLKLTMKFVYVKPRYVHMNNQI